MKQTLILVIVGAFFAGCTTGARYTEANPKVPAGFTAEMGAGTSEEPVEAVSWWRFLGDEALNQMIDRVARANYDVRLAEARVREARGSRQAVGASLMPSTGISASWTASQMAEEDFQDFGSPVSAGISGGPGGLTRNFSIRGDQVGFNRTAGAGGVSNGFTFSGEAPEGIERRSDLFQAGLDSQWEIDIFGGDRASLAAASAGLRAAEHSRDAVLVSVLAEAALAYIDLRAAQHRRLIAAEDIAAQEETLKIARERFRVGLTTEFDATRAETQLATLRAGVPPIENTIAAAKYRLALLAGEEPGALDAILDAPVPLPATPSEIAVGLPSDLLRRRADVQAAEAQLAAARARIKVAVADLFPKFYLNSSLSGQGVGLGDVITPGGRVWSLGPSVKWDILRSGYIRANIEVQSTRQEQAAIAYEQAAAIAVDEVERALTAYAKENEHRAALQSAVQGAEKSVQLATERYLRGLDGFLNVLAAQQQLYASRAALVGSEAAVLTNLIAVYKALGGGWEAFPLDDAPETQAVAGNQEAPGN